MTEYIIKVDEDKKDIMGGCPLTEKPRELVRCKDCALRFTDKCVLHDQAFPVNKGFNWFCADGERKEGR